MLRAKRSNIQIFKYSNIQTGVQVRHLARLRHPNVVAFVGACVEKASFCIVTELVRPVE
jgi:hypothetical protein